MKKYDFIKKDEDITILKYKEKEFEIKKDVRLMKDFQDLNNRARKRMIFDLAKDGLSIKQLTVETKKDGKTYYDNSNAKAMEEAYVNEVSLELFDELSQRYFKMGLADLIQDIGLTEENEVTKFSEDFIQALLGQKIEIPSGR